MAIGGVALRGVGVDRVAERRHDGRCAQPATRDVADDEQQVPVVEPEHVVPVAADVDALHAGDVAHARARAPGRSGSASGSRLCCSVYATVRWSARSCAFSAAIRSSSAARSSACSRRRISRSTNAAAANRHEEPEASEHPGQPHQQRSAELRTRREHEQEPLVPVRARAPGPADPEAGRRRRCSTPAGSPGQRSGRRSRARSRSPRTPRWRRRAPAGRSGAATSP